MGNGSDNVSQARRSRPPLPKGLGPAAAEEAAQGQICLQAFINEILMTSFMSLSNQVPVAERLRRQTANLIPTGIASSNLVRYDVLVIFCTFLLTKCATSEC